MILLDTHARRRVVGWRGVQTFGKAKTAVDEARKTEQGLAISDFGATALVEDIPLITADREIRNSRAFPTIW